MGGTGDGAALDDEAHGIARLPLAFRPSLHTLDEVLRALMPFYGPNCPIAAVYHTEGIGEARFEATLGTLLGKLGAQHADRAPLLYIG